MPAGRPSLYSNINLDQIKKLASFGLTNIQIAQFIGIAEHTLYEWKLVHPEFTKALKEGKEDPDNQVVNSLFRRAIGYEYEETVSEPVVVQKTVDGVEQKIMTDTEMRVVKRVKKVMPPNVTACIFWLKNRRPDLWRDVKEHTGSVAFILEDSQRKDSIGFIQRYSGYVMQN